MSTTKTLKQETPKAATSCGPSLECGIPDNKSVDNVLSALDDAIKQRNQSFDTMTKMEKRTEIAKDVIASLNAKKYIAIRGTYVELYDKKKTKRQYENGEADEIKLTKDNINKESTVCRVCAIGSVFTSFAIKTKSPLSSDSNSMLRSMNSIFSKTEMRILEMLFEGSFVEEELFKKLDAEKRKIIKHEGARFKRKSRGSADKRLRAIMNNYIKNKGTFVFGEMVLDGSF